MCVHSLPLLPRDSVPFHCLQAKLSHNSLCCECVYVSASTSQWKIGGFEAASLHSKTDAAVRQAGGGEGDSGLVGVCSSSPPVHRHHCSHPPPQHCPPRGQGGPGCMHARCGVLSGVRSHATKCVCVCVEIVESQSCHHSSHRQRRLAWSGHGLVLNLLLCPGYLQSLLHLSPPCPPPARPVTGGGGAQYLPLTRCVGRWPPHAVHCGECWARG